MNFYLRNNKGKYNTTAVLSILLSIFFLLKIIHVSIPLFHDELGVYGRALFHMLDNGPQLYPGGIDHYITRGHPLFFAFFLSIFTKLGGGTIVAARCVILLTSISLLLTTYFLGKEISGKKTGILASVTLAFQPIFFAQSTLILPEILLSLLGMLCLLFYLKKKYLFFFFFASLMALTKETSVVIFAGIAIHEWYKDNYKISPGLILRIAKWSVPTLFFLVFLIIQNYQCGYFLYPYHTNLVSFSITSILLRLALNIIAIFLDQGRFMLTFAIIIALFRMTKKERIEIFHKISIPVAVILMMLLFSCINYFMPRYFLLVLPLMMIAFFTIVESRGYTFKHLVVYFLLTLPFQCNFFVFRNDDNMGYLIVVENMKKSIAELDRLTEGKKVRVFAQFPEINALDFPENGYTNNPNYLLTTVYSDSVEYILKSGQEYIILDRYINKVDYNLDQSIDSIVQDAMTNNESNVKLLYDRKLFFNRQRIFKTNN